MCDKDPLVPPASPHHLCFPGAAFSLLPLAASIIADPGPRGWPSAQLLVHLNKHLFLYAGLLLCTSSILIRVCTGNSALISLEKGNVNVGLSPARSIWLGWR